jgi:hypothetical protein
VAQTSTPARSAPTILTYCVPTSTGFSFRVRQRSPRVQNPCTQDRGFHRQPQVSLFSLLLKWSVRQCYQIKQSHSLICAAPFLFHSISSVNASLSLQSTSLETSISPSPNLTPISSLAALCPPTRAQTRPILSFSAPPPSPSPSLGFNPNFPLSNSLDHPPCKG